VRFPTPEFLEDLERGGPVMDILMPELTPREAWLLNQFLEEVHEALWDAYAEDILDYQDRQDFPDLHPPEDSEPTPPSGLDPWTGPNIPF
jgi:hypothetical protein